MVSKAIDVGYTVSADMGQVRAPNIGFLASLDGISELSIISVASATFLQAASAMFAETSAVSRSRESLNLF
jgi:hypothetical protein